MLQRLNVSTAILFPMPIFSAESGFAELAIEQKPRSKERPDIPTKRMAYERLKQEVEKGRGEEKCFYADVAREQEERIKNGKRKERFVLVTGDPDLCSQFEAAKDRIFRRVKNKSVALTLMERAWNEALSDTEIDKILAAEEGPFV